MKEYNSERNQIIIASNRLPIVIKKAEDGSIQIENGAGGLVTAMAPVLKNRNGTWVGWPGYVQEIDSEGHIGKALESAMTGYCIKPVILSDYELKNYYEGFSNSVLWPLFHGFTDKCVFNQEYWENYRKVNEKFAVTIYKNAQAADFIWVHDYQLLLVGSQLRKKQLQNRIGFFLHIPFPAVEIFSRCPWRFEVLNAMLEYDVIGFHTIQHKRNFIGSIKKLVQQAEIDDKAAFDETVSELTIGDRVVRIGVFPISIDYDEFFHQAWNNKVSKRSKEIRGNAPGAKILIGVDRLDYTKGIPEKLRAFQRFLTRYPEYHKKAYFIQIVVPSRREINAYADLKLKIEQLVGEINGMFSTNEWIPVHYMFRSVDRNELVALYRAGDIAFITPLKDGMNLVAKEYCACNIDEKGVLVLSEFAGAAQQFHKEAILVNPHDTDGTAIAIKKAFQMPLAEKNYRMHNLRENVKTKDVLWWLNSFLNAAVEKDLSNFPIVDEYFPVEPDQKRVGMSSLMF